MSNAGLFTTVAREYANFRPGYPPDLFAWPQSLGAVWPGAGASVAVRMPLLITRRAPAPVALRPG